MSEWNKCRLGDIATSANTGLDAIKRAPIVGYDTGVKCLRIQDVSQNKAFSDWGFCQVEENNYNRFSLKKGDIYIARTGASIGVNMLISDDIKAVFNNGLVRLRINKDVANYKYVYYSLCSYEYRGHIEGISGGTSTQPNMQINALLDYEITIPSLPSQQAIVEILSSLDDKIYLLKRQNNTLEALAQTYFQQWFVEDANECWENDVLGNYVEITRGASPRPIIKFVTDGVFPWVKIGDATSSNSVFINSTKESIIEEGISKSVIARRGDIILSNSATCGLPYIMGIDGCVHDGWLIFREFHHLTKWYVYFLLYAMQREIVQQADGTVQDNLNTTILKNLSIKVPDSTSITKFDELAEAIINKIERNNTQIQTLQKLRDTLLPKLMCGEVKVKL
jgi:type I restriction enzyme S subunit